MRGRPGDVAKSKEGGRGKPDRLRYKSALGLGFDGLLILAKLGIELGSRFTSEWITLPALSATKTERLATLRRPVFSGITRVSLTLKALTATRLKSETRVRLMPACLAQASWAKGESTEMAMTSAPSFLYSSSKPVTLQSSSVQTPVKASGTKRITVLPLPTLRRRLTSTRPASVFCLREISGRGWPSLRGMVRVGGGSAVKLVKKQGLARMEAVIWCKSAFFDTPRPFYDPKTPLKRFIRGLWPSQGAGTICAASGRGPRCPS